MSGEFPFEHFISLHRPKEEETYKQRPQGQKDAKNITFRIDDEGPTAGPSKKQGKFLGSAVDPSKSFENFIVGPSNNMAFATAMAITQGPGKSGKYPSLYFYGDSGLGKTHLLHAIANGTRKSFPELVICLTTTRDFMKEMIEAIRAKALDGFQRKYSKEVDVLMIDDIHELNNKHSTQNEFFHIFNELYNEGKQLVFTSDRSPKEIEGIPERIKTRLGWGLVIDIQRPDFETRLAILKMKANQLDFFLPDDALELIAARFTSSIRELEGALIRLSAFADVAQLEIDTEVAKDLLKLESTEATKNRPSMESIINAVADQYKVVPSEIKSRSRDRTVMRARHVGIFLSRKILQATHQEIAHYYGNRNYSTIVHSIKTMAEKIPKSPSLSKEMAQIESSLSGQC